MSTDSPSATRHSFALEDGRQLAYYTWGESTGHPVLYVHGFPAAGEEGSMCAHQVAHAGGRLVALDRPGMGFSDPYPTCDGNLETYCHNTWEFVRAQNEWTEFSILGVSGGVPFCLALLASWLQDSTELPTLTTVTLVAGVCVSAGVQDMTDENQQMVGLVAKDRRFWLSCMMGIPSLMVRCLPTSWMAKLIPTAGLPPSDVECLQDQQTVTELVELSQTAFRQGRRGPTQDAAIVLQAQHPHEEVIQQMYAEASTNRPTIGIFQGDLDVDVPKSHAVYLHETIFSKHAKLHTYPDLGHLSVVMTKAKEYAAFCVSGESMGK